MFGSKFGRYIIIATLILGGVSFIALIMSNFDTEAETIVSELLAVIVLLVVLMGAALLTALGLRALQNRRDKPIRKQEEEDGAD